MLDVAPFLPAGTTIDDIATAPSSGTAVVNSDDTITYTPSPPGFVGNDAFTFTGTTSGTATTYAASVAVGPQYCSTCVAAGAQCTTGADCCSGVCSPGYVGGKPVGLCFDESTCPPCASSQLPCGVGSFVSAPRTLADESFFNLLLACGVISDCFQSYCDGSTRGSTVGTNVKVLDLASRAPPAQSAAQGASSLSVGSGLQLVFANTAAAFGVWYSCSEPPASAHPRRASSPPPPHALAAPSPTARAPEFTLTAYSWLGAAATTTSLSCPPAGAGPAFTGWFAGTPVSAGILSVSIAALPGATSLLNVAAAEYAPLLHADHCVSWPSTGGVSLSSLLSSI